MIRRGGRETRSADRVPPPEPAPPLELVRATRKIFAEVHATLDLLDAAEERTRGEEPS